MRYSLETGYFVMLLIAGVSLVIGSEPAAAAICDFKKDPITFEFIELRPEVTLDHRKSSSEIDQLSRELADGEDFHKRMEPLAGQAKSNGNTLSVLGLTLGPAEVRFRLGFRSRIMMDDSYCAYINKIVMKFGFKEMRVYLSNQLVRDSCRYKVFFDHEMEHVRLSNMVLTRFVAKLKKLENYVRETPIRNGQETDQVTQELQDDLLKKVAELVGQFDQELKTVNDVLDTIENYQRMHAICS